MVVWWPRSSGRILTLIAQKPLSPNPKKGLGECSTFRVWQKLRLVLLGMRGEDSPFPWGFWGGFGENVGGSSPGILGGGLSEGGSEDPKQSIKRAGPRGPQRTPQTRGFPPGGGGAPVKPFLKNPPGGGWGPLWGCGEPNFSVFWGLPPQMAPLAPFLWRPS